MGYRDADGLDLFGPAEVFAEAVRQLGAPVYELVMSAVGGGAMTLTSGISVAAADLTAIRPQAERHRDRGRGRGRGDRRRGEEPRAARAG